MSSLAELLSLGAPQGSLAAAAPRGMQFNLPQAAPQAAPQQQRYGHGIGGFLGMLGDAMLIAHGKDPIYQQRIQQQQQTQALQGFLTNPDQAIQSLMAIPGQAANGIDLYKAVHPASETPLELKLLAYQKAHPEDSGALHGINVDLHPGLSTPTEVQSGAIVGGATVVTTQQQYEALPAGSPYYYNGKYGVKGGGQQAPGGQPGASSTGGFQ